MDIGSHLRAEAVPRP